MLKIGLTGGIGSGKTTVARLFESFGTSVIDADEVARQLVTIGRPALAGITHEFGAEVLNPDGSLNRNNLREQVFSNPGQKQKLEAILHPLIYKAIEADIKKLDANYCIISVPLLLETGMARFVDRILVVDCPVEAQIERVKNRDNLPLERIQSIIDSQVSRAFRKSKADDIIDNSETDYSLAEQVKKLHNLYLLLSL